MARREMLRSLSRPRNGTEGEIGWEELEPLLADCTPAWGETQTGVPARLIEEAARLYGRGPSLLWLGQALQRQPTGGNVMRACALLPAVTGNLGKPGAGLLYLNFNLARRGIDDAYLVAPHLCTDTPPRISQMDLAACLEDPARGAATARAARCRLSFRQHPRHQPGHAAGV